MALAGGVCGYQAPDGFRVNVLFGLFTAFRTCPGRVPTDMFSFSSRSEDSVGETGSPFFFRTMYVSRRLNPDWTSGMNTVPTYPTAHAAHAAVNDIGVST